ncbi:MAG: hypothetical protein GWN11_00780 [Candidatus Dadabacteria bacterium]|nr:hypothetical protein [Candidatus Dadabacteria bacterium]
MCLFIKQFFTKPLSTGAIHPSSDELAELITDTAELKKRSVIVEIGSGTGVFTQKICEKKNDNAGFFVIELNPLFVEHTKRRCPAVNVVEDSAANINLHLKNKGYNSCECIISGLPWASFDNNMQDSILHNLYDAMAPGAVFLTFSYVQSLLMPSGRRFKNKLISMFGSVEQTKIIWKNVPPAFVYWVYKS